jgi:hypothetical protein
MILYKITFKDECRSTIKIVDGRLCFFLNDWRGRTFIAIKVDDLGIYRFWRKDNLGKELTYYEWIEKIEELP